MKKIYLLFAALFVIACTEDKTNDADYTYPIPEDHLNSSDADFVSKAEASDVANLFFSTLSGNDGITRSLSVTDKGTALTENGTNKTIKSLEVIHDEESGARSMYIINYNGGGFVIISGTKTFHPILAYSDDGFISVDMINNLNEGLTIWAEETKLAISESKSLPEDSLLRVRNLWTPYEILNSQIPEATTRAFTNEQYYKFRERLGEAYKLYPGYSFGPLTSAQSFLSESEYKRYVEEARRFGSPPECTLLGYKYTPVNEVGPLIGTTWHQGSPFNSLIRNRYPAGCVAIAMAQIMKFHKHPANYDWDNMLKTTATISTQQLIYDIGVAVNMNYGADGSGASDSDAKKGWSKMGYNVTLKDHKHEDVRKELLINKRPVHMFGFKNKTLWVYKNGHAWVCEGARSTNTTVTYFIEYQHIYGMWTSMDGPSYNRPAGTTGIGNLYFYLNWGWGSNNGNGWFSFSNVDSPKGSYKYGRTNLYINPK